MNVSGILLIATLCSFSCNANQRNKPEIIENRINADTVTTLDNCIFYIFQDSKDNYWFGSDGKGIYKYDGRVLLQFSTKHGLDNDRIRGIQEDKDGNILVNTLEGVNKFDGEQFHTLPVIESGSSEEAWTMNPDDLWFKAKNGQGGPYRYDGKNLYHLEFPKHFMADEYFARFPNNAWSPYEIYDIYKDHQGNIWFGTGAFGICRFDGKTLSWLYEKELTEMKGGGSFGIRSIIEDKDGKFWFCNSRNRYTINPGYAIENGYLKINYTKEKGIKHVKSDDGDLFYFMSVKEDNQQNLWMSTYSQGVYKYDGKKLTHYPLEDGETNIRIFSVYMDRKGDIWLATHDAGAIKFERNTFRKFRP